MDSEHRLCSLELAYQTLREEFNLLQSCLIDKHVLNGTEVGMRLHRKRWAAVRKASAWSGEASLLDIMSVQGLTSPILNNVGTEMLNTCRATSWSLHDCVDMVSMRAIVCGGHGVNGERLRSVERFDSQLGAWETLPLMQISRIKSAAAVLDGHLYVCGICGSTGDPGGVVQRLNRDTLTWVSVAPMPTLRCEFGAAAIGKYLYVCGGIGKPWGGYESSVLSSVDRFSVPSDCARGRWESVQPMRESRRGHGVATISGLLIVCGGRKDDWEMKSSVECFRPPGQQERRQWLPSCRMLEARCNFAAAALRNRVLVCGGLDQHHVTLSSAECYDLASGDWTLMAPMHVPRHHHAATSIGTIVFVCGGHQSEYDSLFEVIDGAATPNPMDSYEQFDLASGEWKMAPSMQSKRCGHVMATVSF